MIDSAAREGGAAMQQVTQVVTHKNLEPVDIAIIIAYFIIVFAIGFYFSLKERTSADYFLASRDVGWFAIGASLFVSNISTEHFIGLAGSGASSGLAVRPSQGAGWPAG